MCTVFHALFIFLAMHTLLYILCFDFGFGPGIKSEVSQPQPKLYPRPSQAAWTDVQPPSLTGSGGCGK